MGSANKSEPKQISEQILQRTPKDLLPKGTFVYATTLDDPSFSISYETNMIDKIKDKEDFKGKEYIYIDHGHSNCISEDLFDYVSEFNDVKRLWISCSGAENISFANVTPLNIKELILTTEATNLNTSLYDDNIEYIFPKLKKLTITSNKLRMGGVFGISKIKTLKSFTAHSFMQCLPDNTLIPLAYHDNLINVNYRAYRNTGGYTVLDELKRVRELKGKKAFNIDYNYS